MASSKFRALVLEALKQFAESGPPSDLKLQDWLARLHYQLDIDVPTDVETAHLLRDVLTSIYTRDVINGGVEKRVPDVLRYTIDLVEPRLRAELDRRIFAAADLIRINKAQRKAETLRRFAGWITSVPVGGSSTTDLRAAASEIVKPIRQIKYEARRVAIDQGHKLAAAVAHVVSQEAGAIAAIWHDRGEFDRSYDARPEHLKRSGKLFLIRDSWAMNEGLIKRGGPYTDEFEDVGEYPFCSCYYEYISSPGRLPDELLTEKGREWVSARHDAAILSNLNAAVARIEPRPSKRQIESGNYRKGHARVAGIDVTIENGRGTVRTGTAADGQTWAVIMPAHYGYIKRTHGADGEHVDVFIGPDPEPRSVWVVSQVNPDTGVYDEDKVLLGFRSRAEALRTYRLAFSDGRGRERIGGVREVSIDAFRGSIAA